VVALADEMIDRLSGLWGAQTPLGIWLEENQMTTLFFGGVNADQCVVCSGTEYTPTIVD
jgi:nicotinamidase-related amidase